MVGAPGAPSIAGGVASVSPMSSEELAARRRRRRVLIIALVAVVALAAYASREVVDGWSSTPSFAVTAIDGVDTVLANPCGMQLQRVWLTVEPLVPSVDQNAARLGDLLPTPVEGSDVLRFSLGPVEAALSEASDETDPGTTGLRLHHEASSPLKRSSGFVALPDPPWPEHPAALDQFGERIAVEELDTC